MNFAINKRQLAIKELLREARVQAEEIRSIMEQELRDFTQAVHVDAEASEKPVVRGDLAISRESREVKWKNRAVPSLTVTEFDVLEYLSSRSEHVRSRPDFLDRIWDEHYICDRSVDSFIKRIRNKFRKVDPEFQQIETIYGIGYKWKR